MTGLIRIDFILCLICGSLAKDVVSDSASELCHTLQVSGVVSQPDCNGRYIIDLEYDIKCSGRLAWTKIQEKPDNNSMTYIYYLEDGYEGWVIARSSCTRWGNFMAMVKTDAKVPFNMLEPWTEYNDNSRTFVVNSNIAFVCTETISEYNLNHKGSDNHLIVKAAIVGLVASLAFVGSIVLICIICRHRRQQVTRSRNDREKEVNRNIYIGKDDDDEATFKYKRMKDTGIQPDIDEVHLQQPLSNGV